MRVKEIISVSIISNYEMRSIIKLFLTAKNVSATEVCETLA